VKGSGIRGNERGYQSGCGEQGTAEILKESKGGNGERARRIVSGMGGE
jgi:hypothetical protein